MDLPDRLRGALQRLTDALDALEAAADRRAAAAAERTDLDTEHAVLQDDRARLAGDLDAALARCRAFDRAVDDVARRLERAEAGLGGILDDLADRGPPAGAA